MKLSLTLSLLLGMATLFQGCGSTEDAPVDNSKKSTTIKGSTTLGSLLSNDATVCLDTNNNKICDKGEPSTGTDALGKYKLTVDSSVDDGTLIIVQDGVNLLPPATGEQKNLKFYKQYQGSEDTQNINVFTTLVTNEMESNASSTYKDAVETVLSEKFGNSTKCSFIDSALVTKDPISKKGTFLVCMNGLQYMTYLDNAAQIQKSSSLRASSQDNNSSLDAYINGNSDYFSSFLDSISEYINDFYSWFDSLLGNNTTDGTKDDNTSTLPPVEQPVEQPKLVEIQRDHLNGIWYIIDASGDKTCSDIRSNNDIAVTEADGKTTDLTLTYDNRKKTMLLKLGFFTADTIKFDKYYESSTEKTFTGNYQSDGETLKGYKMDTLANCKSSKLGL